MLSHNSSTSVIIELEMRLRASIVVDETASLSEVKLEAGLQWCEKFFF